MKNIYLIGFMGTGKTVCGKIVAQSLNKEFVEMDEVIERREGTSIVDIFRIKGEAYFRKLEQTLLKELAARENLVVSCGGGLACNQENLTLLKTTGFVFALAAAPEVIYGRVKNERHRPLLNVIDPLEKIKQLLNERKPYYQQAHYTIETSYIPPEEVARKIIAIVQ